MDNISGITNSAITRISRKAGIHRINSESFNKIRDIIKLRIVEILERCNYFMQYLGKKIINVNIMVTSLPVHMFTNTLIYKIYKPLKINNKSNIVLKQIKYYQKITSVFLIRKCSFLKLIKKLLNNNAKISKLSLDYLQIYIESSIVDFLIKSKHNISHASRITLFTEDLILVEKNESPLYIVNNLFSIPTYNFEKYIVKVFKQNNSNYHLSKDFKSQINGFLNYITIAICNISNFLTNNEFNNIKSSKIIGTREIQLSVKLLLNGELQNYAISAGSDAVVKSLNAIKTIEIKSRSFYAGLSFSVSQCENIIRKSGKKVGLYAPVYMCAVIEYICREFVEISQIMCKNYNKNTINARHLFLAIDKDNEFKELFKKFNYKIISN